LSFIFTPPLHSNKIILFAFYVSRKLRSRIFTTGENASADNATYSFSIFRI
jgi:hypothetical protein